MKVTRTGFVRCPSCLSHIKAVSASLECPFCNEQFDVSDEVDQIGGGALSLLKSSRAGIVAMSLAGLTMTVACGDKDEKDTNNNPDMSVEDENNQIEENIYANDYGGFENLNNLNNFYVPDMGGDVGDAGEDVGEDVGDAGDSD